MHLYLSHKRRGVEWQPGQRNNSELCQNSYDATHHYSLLWSGFIAPLTYEIISFAEAVPTFCIASGVQNTSIISIPQTWLIPGISPFTYLNAFSSHVLLTELNEDYASTFYDFFARDLEGRVLVS